MPPLVTLITPSLNQGRFLRQAADSVLAQSYPHLEYWVIDGGSTDGTIDILRSYGQRLHWVSESDRGQSHAINKGLRRARGSLVGWLNADDVLAADAIATAVEALEAHPETGLVYGHGEIIDEDGHCVGPFPGTEPFNLYRLLFHLDFVLQPATLFRRDLVEEIGYLDEGLQWAMDWDLWIRLAAVSDVVRVDEVLAKAREHRESKTAAGGWRRVAELSRLARRHTGDRVTRGVVLYALDTLLGDIERLPGPLRRVLRARVLQVWRWLLETAPVHSDGWFGRRGWVVVPRRWARFRIVLEAPRVAEGAPMAVTVVFAGRAVTRFSFDRPGVHEIDLDRLPGRAPFARLAISSNRSVRSEVVEDRRRLAVRLVELRRLQ